jgi:hypothetical protein
MILECSSSRFLTGETRFLSGRQQTEILLKSVYVLCQFSLNSQKYRHALLYRINTLGVTATGPFSNPSSVHAEVSQLYPGFSLPPGR